jgi:hypothetical protein
VILSRVSVCCGSILKRTENFISEITSGSETCRINVENVKDYYRESQLMVLNLCLCTVTTVVILKVIAGGVGIKS